MTYIQTEEEFGVSQCTKKLCVYTYKLFHVLATTKGLHEKFWKIWCVTACKNSLYVERQKFVELFCKE
jgi:hypothetical protein